MKKYKTNFIRNLYIKIAKFYFVSNFVGSTRVLGFLFSILPLKTGPVRHPLGFSWEIDSRESLWTYLTSCEKYTTRIVLSIVSNLDTFICIGANRGWYPLLVGQKSKKVRIIAFEPNTLTNQILKENVATNENQCEIFPLAIGETESNASLFQYTTKNDAMCTLYPTIEMGENPYILENISVESLDFFVKRNLVNLGTTLLFMDIEGGEMVALQGAKETLIQNKPTVICEVNPILLRASGSSHQDLFELMDSLSYIAYWIDERQYLRKLENLVNLPHLAVLPLNSGANYLFVHSDNHVDANSWGLECLVDRPTKR